jgi:SAM-dependent methyltransferase
MTHDYAAYQREKAQVIGSLRGDVLEIGAGKGRNFDLLASGVSWTGLEPNRRLRAALESAARRRGWPDSVLDAPAEEIPLPAASVDGVLATVVLCSVSDQDLALAEIRRVLRPGGRFAFAEHVGAPRGTWRRRAQAVLAPFSRRFDHGCDPTRDTEAAIRRSGLQMSAVGHFDLPALPGVTMPYVVGVGIR